MSPGGLLIHIGTMLGVMLWMVVGGMLLQDAVTLLAPLLQ